MGSYQQMQSEFAATVKTCLADQTHQGINAPQDVSLDALIDALPYYGNLTFENMHRAALANLLEIHLPHRPIAPHPDLATFGSSSKYAYTGTYQCYRDAFYPGVASSPIAEEAGRQMCIAQANIDDKWWGEFGVAALTDAVRVALSFSLDTDKLAGALTSKNGALRKALAASYLAVLSTGYSPTASILRSLNDGQRSNNASQLSAAIINGRFTANINETIDMGGDGAVAATWFLFNLWIALKTLGHGNVDGVIEQSTRAGLKVPPEVGPASWWNGGYTAWFHSLDGNDVSEHASKTIHADMPEKVEVIASNGSRGTFQFTNRQDEKNGYSLSLCNWGDLSWYQPPSSSCLGKGTMVLMADGTSKTIESVVIGDTVHSNLGPRKVVLIESPKRMKRSLYQLNGLPLFATSAHPFRTADDIHGSRAAVAPWALIDSIPSMTASGVATLRPGLSLAARIDGRVQSEPVTRIEEHVSDDPDERVYDLLLENWAEDHPAYFVGGPTCFFAVDAETADPGYDLSNTLAIAAGMRASVDICRQVFPNPETGMAEAIDRLPVDAWLDSVLATEASRDDAHMALRTIPNTSFFLRHGAWDYHASVLEAQLVRSHARRIRRNLRNPFPRQANTTDESTHFGICLRDIEFLGEAGIATDTVLSVDFRLRSSGVEDRLQTLDVETTPATRWFITPDAAVDFGRHPLTEKSVLEGCLRQGVTIIGRFRFDVASHLARSTQVHFIYGNGGTIIGRIALDEIQLASNPSLGICRRGVSETMTAAVSVGNRMGLELVRAIEEHWAELTSQQVQ